MRRRAGCALLAGLLAGAAPASAGPPDAPPLLLPTRDVAVTYRQEQGSQVLGQQLHWSAATRRMRLDGPGSFLIFDYVTQRGDWGRIVDRSYVEVRQPGGLPGTQPAGGFVRTGAARIAGLDCVEWGVRDTAPQTRICLTEDGVMLRMTIVGQMAMTATDILYAPQDPALFVVPEGYIRGARRN